MSEPSNEEAGQNAAEHRSGMKRPENVRAPWPTGDRQRCRGSAEGAEPVAAAPLSGALPRDWDPDLYLAMNPDVEDEVRCGRYASPDEHWLEIGRHDEEVGRRPTVNDPAHYEPPPPGRGRPPSEAELVMFDPHAYLDRNPGIAVDITVETALDHWMFEGRYEGRTPFSPSRYARRRIEPSKLFQRPFGVNFYAPLSVRTGLGTAARGYLRAMRAAAIPVQLYNLNHDLPDNRVTARDYDKPARYRVNLIHANADSMERVSVNFRLEQFDDAYTIAIWAWELNCLRPDWFQAFAAADEIWTPSDFNTAAVLAMSPVPVRTMNHALVTSRSISECYDRAYFGLPEGFLFLTAFDVGSRMDRKNPQAVLAAFEAAFSDREDVALVLKYHRGRLDQPAVQDLVARVRGKRNVIVRTELMSDAEMRGLQGCADCLVSAHRGEGFGLNVAEFMQLGKPVIVTGYSGNMDFTDEQNSYLISYRLRPLQQPSGPYMPGYLWAEPDVAELARLMRHVLEAPDDATRVGRAGAATVNEMLSPEAVGRLMLARLDELGLREPLPPFLALAGASRELRTPPEGTVAPVLDPVDRRCHPTVSVVATVRDAAPERLIRCIESVRAQSYGRWELCLCDDASAREDTVALLRRYQGLDPRIKIMRLPRRAAGDATNNATAPNAAVLMATGEYLIVLGSDDELTDDALEHVRSAVAGDPGIDVLYGDEEKIVLGGHRWAYRRDPAWSPEHLEAAMDALHPLAVRTSLFLEAGGFRAGYGCAQDYDLMLRLSRRTGRIHHIPHPVYRRHIVPGSSAAADWESAAHAAARRALADHIRTKYGEPKAEVEDGLLPGLFRVRHRIKGNPPVSLLVATDNRSVELPGRGAPFVMVENMVRSIREHTAYRNYEIVVVDNGGTPARLAQEYVPLGVTLYGYAGPKGVSNRLDKVRFALRQVRTENVVLLDDDLEMFDDDWLSALLEFSQSAEIGGCSGKLLCGADEGWRVGVAPDADEASSPIDHGLRGVTVDQNGHGEAIGSPFVLTGACLATRLSVLHEVGMFGRKLATPPDGVDLCLKMRQQGYRLVYTPYSRAFHLGAVAARRTALAREEAQRL